MCPFCLSTIGLVVAGAVSTGGLTALVAKLSRKENNAKEATPSSNERNSPVQRIFRAGWSQTNSKTKEK
jgi:hypothetical protein